MKKEIIEKIELLVEMSGTTNSYDTLNEELNALNLEIEKQKNTVRDLKKSMTNNKYLKANERIIDENIKMGLENRLSVYYEDLKSLESEIALVSMDEETLHNCILSLETELSQLRKFLESLELKMKTIGEKDPSIYSFYDSLITKTNDDILKLNKVIEKKKSEYNAITTRMSQLGESRASLEEKIKKEEENLEDVCITLSNPSSYIDYRAKKSDELAIDEYIEDLETLEHKRLEILTDPAFIGQEAKELYLEDDKTSSLDKIKELVTIIHSKPYMDVNYEDLDELLEDATNRRDEFANIVENRSYDGEDVSVINMRVLYLEKLKLESEEKLKSLKDEINHIDLVFVKDLAQQIEQIKETRNKLNDDIDAYKKVIRDNEEHKTPKKKAILKSALKRKLDELENVENILNSFEQDLESAVIKSKKLEEESIREIQYVITNYDKELADIKKKSIMNTRSKDILAVEKDKDELKKLSDDVQNIMNRKKYSKTPMDIFDEIEMIYGTDIEDDTVVEEIDRHDINLNDFRIETPLETESFIEEPTIEEPLDFDFINKSQEQDFLSEESVTPFDDVLSERQEDVKYEEENLDKVEKVSNENIFKVIKIEPIEETKEKEEQVVEALLDDQVLSSDFEDTDFISFNDLLAGDIHEN